MGKLLAARFAEQYIAVVGLAAVTFLGSAGAAVLLDFLEDSAGEGTVLGLVTRGSQAVESPFGTLGLLDRFSVHHGLSEALSS